LTAALSSSLAITGLGPGHVLGRYELLLPVAAGGMAMVWAARMTGSRGFQKIVAVKTMLPQLSEDDEFEQMFLDEASLASQVRHPHVVEILDLGEHEGVLFLVMEWIDGVPLNRLAKLAKPHNGVPLGIATRIVMAASAGLHAAHELKRDGVLVGLVHRDVSPQNILVTGEGVTKVVDFGVAKATALGGGATVAGQVKGKISYMSPEQGRGDPIDRRTDVFALGTVLYALTTGKHPFRRESEGATMMAICSDEPVIPPSQIVPSYPRALEAIVLKATAKDKQQRFASADELFRALDQLPAEIRASSDEDVGAYVRHLAGAELEERRKQLRLALERSGEERSVRTLTLPGREQQSGKSSVGSVSVVGTTASLHPNGDDELKLWERERKKRRKVLAVSGVALALAAGGLGFAFMSSREPVVTPSPVPAQASSAAPVAVEPPSSTSAPEAPKVDEAPKIDEAPKADADVAPLSTAAPRDASDKEIKPAATPHKKPSTSSSKEQSANTKATATKPVQKAPQWRNDPGF
jgi:serine/threonine protein kinase